MSSFRKVILTTALVAMAGMALAQSDKYPGLGRVATPKEVAKWDIDVRPDFKGLPPGSGTVAKGQDVWEAKCAHCHGIFGESNEVFSALIGGTTAEDIKTGHVANLTRTDFPGRTTLMKVATVSTLWDYINRAMPWTSPKTLTTEEVYSVTAFLLSLANVVPDDFTLSDRNMAEVQKRMPNRNGMTTAHAMWPGKEFNGTARPDTANVICMKDCSPEPKLASLLPDFARNAHGNLSEQNRLVGQQKGADTTRPEGKAAPQPGAGAATPAAAPRAEANSESRAAIALLNKHSCTACHGVDKKVVGPGFNEIAKKHAGKADYLAGKIKSGGAGVWGPIPMPPQSLPEADAKAIAAWIAKGASK
ncbi:MAG: c-type cytochrome [Limnohabitans sp.]